MTGGGPRPGGSPDWLPDVVPSSGDWIAYIEQLWQLYQADFVRSRALWRGKPVWVDVDPQSGGKDRSFWHIISGVDPKTKELKDPEPDRCSRLCWVRPILEADPADVRTWIQAPNGFILIALPDFSYVVVLKERPNKAFLKSAYYIERATRREQYRKQYEASDKR